MSKTHMSLCFYVLGNASLCQKIGLSFCLSVYFFWCLRSYKKLGLPRKKKILAGRPWAGPPTIKLASATRITNAAIWYYSAALLVLLSFICEVELVVTCAFFCRLDLLFSLFFGET